jgi:hypothetical protein
MSWLGVDMAAELMKVNSKIGVSKQAEDYKSHSKVVTNRKYELIDNFLSERRSPISHKWSQGVSQ